MKKLEVIKNTVKARNNYFSKKLILDNKPTLLWIEPTNHCNLQCIMCPNKLIPLAKKGFMSMDMFKSIIDEIKPHTASIFLLVGGESLLHPKIDEMISYARQNQIRVLLNTNGTVMTPALSKKIIDAGLSYVTFAMDGYTKETYESIRVNAKFDKVVENVKSFLEYRKTAKNKPFVVITTLLIKVEDTLEKNKRAFRDLFKGYNIDMFLEKRPNSWGNKFKDTKVFTPIADNYEHACSHLWSTLTILWDGTVVPCCFDFQGEYNLGNVSKDKILDIWNSEKMTNLRKAHIDKTYKKVNPLCEGCAIVTGPMELGLPPGMKAAVADSITNITGFWLERELIKISERVMPNPVLRVKK